MILDCIHSDASECRSRIEDDFQVDLDDNVNTHHLLLRGENFPYEKSECSMKRFLTEKDGKTMRPFYIVSPFIDFEDVYAEYHSTTHDLSEEEGAGFLQHYGFPTDLFDFSPSFETARFFAAYGRSTDPVGIIGVFRYQDLEQHFTITDLSNHPFALRPRSQHAFAGRPNPGILDLKAPRYQTLLTSKWYRFKKSAADLAFATDRVSLTYPTEREIAHFFSRDLDEFVKEHFTYTLMTDEQRSLVHEKLESIRNQLKI